MSQWVIRSEACLAQERPETVRVGVALAQPNIQSAPGESRAEQRKAARKCAAGELLGSVMHLESTSSVGEPAEGSLPRDASSTVHSRGRRTLARVLNPARRTPSLTTSATRSGVTTATRQSRLARISHARRYPQMFITFGNGYLGSCDDEERSEMRYVMRTAERESSNL